jgi:2-polyprenyl-3-methyl-5-hydroxy-6-metoxy-1,4-benzoquinol methylase
VPRAQEDTIVDYRERAYKDYISTHYEEGNRHLLEPDSRTLKKYYRLNHLPHLPPDKNAQILDIGCGMGHFLEFLRDSGYKSVRGIDRGDEAVEYCLSRNLQVEKADALSHLSHCPSTYDAIVLNDIIEHFTKPEMFDLIGACYEALRPNGVVIIKMVNAANPLMGAHSLAIDLTHEVILSEESLAQLLNVFSFRDVKVLPLNIYTKPYNPVHWLARCASGCLNSVWRILFFLYGRPGTRCFTKGILAVGSK